MRRPEWIAEPMGETQAMLIRVKPFLQMSLLYCVNSRRFKTLAVLSQNLEPPLPPVESA